MASETDEKAKMESLTSAAAFVEGGIQDACNICLEAFCESDPSADQPKWMDQHMSHQNPPPNPIGIQSNTVDLDAEDSVPSSFTSKRPLGHDSSKEKAKKQRSVDTSSTFSEYLRWMGEISLERLSVFKLVASIEERKLESMNKNERQKLILERKKLNLEKLRMDRQKLKEDKEEEVMILGMDLSKCNPLLRQCYEAKQQEILARVIGNSSSSK
ncbi:uncharacterized protein LOC103648089 [Zea mays]|nr:uncharacterized protein LOC103648089 [Zea mays]NP_001402795.1 uncharacterized protein LOC103648089 [Zea mays]ACG32704.1 hypothetical protein [Zea mays]ACL52862.1 unknown [Zea mays]|eukprot:NP_001316461.1 uncharacterized LOC103648089 [Zea mays]